MNTPFSNQKPNLLTAIAVMTLVSGITNLFWGFFTSLGAIGTFFGAICLPLTILPIILGIFEIIYAAKLLSTQPQPVQASPSIAAFQIATCLYGNIFSMVVGILNLIFFNDQAVKEYFSRITEVHAPTPRPSTSASLPGSTGQAALPDAEKSDQTK
jgi:hypothetical protein